MVSLRKLPSGRKDSYSLGLLYSIFHQCPASYRCHEQWGHASCRIPNIWLGKLFVWDQLY
jgi:hypothetical protein